MQPPGREERIREPSYLDMHTLVMSLTDALAGFTDKPFVFFGHSMGAAVAFEVAHELRRRRLPQPAHLLLSAFSAPQCPRRRGPLAQLPDADFVAELKQMGGSPREVLDNQEVMELLLPTLRADFQLIEQYRYQESALLDCGMTVFGGREDDDAPFEDLEAWQLHTTGIFRVQTFSGGHFYLMERGDELRAAISNDLRHLADQREFPDRPP